MSADIRWTGYHQRRLYLVRRHQRRSHINSAAAGPNQLARLFGDLDEDVQRNAENAAIRRVATRSELVKLGLMKEKDAW